MDVTVDNEKATLLTFVFSVVIGLHMGLLSTMSQSTNTKCLSLFSPFKPLAGLKQNIMKWQMNCRTEKGLNKASISKLTN